MRKGKNKHEQISITKSEKPKNKEKYTRRIDATGIRVTMMTVPRKERDILKCTFDKGKIYKIVDQIQSQKSIRDEKKRFANFKERKKILRRQQRAENPDFCLKHLSFDLRRDLFRSMWEGYQWSQRQAYF